MKLARKGQGWSQADLAQRTGYSQATLSRLEREQSRVARDTAARTGPTG
ncbi:MAG: helix-turn-helix domain-containing protein [Sciscionella sp.]